MPDCDLLLVGDGPERTKLQQDVVRLGISDRVHFAGWQADVPPILAAAELLVLPSNWEGMPNVVLEAMAAGKPVLATRAEGVVELLGPGADEQTIPIGDKRALVARARSLLANPSRANELGAQNRSRAEAEFSLDRMIARFEDLYRPGTRD